MCNIAFVGARKERSCKQVKGSIISSRPDFKDILQNISSIESPNSFHMTDVRRILELNDSCIDMKRYNSCGVNMIKLIALL